LLPGQRKPVEYIGQDQMVIQFQHHARVLTRP
jgi:hypothetical protein